MAEKALPSPSSQNTSLPADACVINGSARAIWHKSAPTAVRRAYASGDDVDGWDAWKRHLARRRRPAHPAKLLPAGSGALGWALPDGLEPRRGPAWLDRAEQLAGDRRPASPAPQRELLAWLGESAGTQADAGYALDALACCHGLPRLAAGLSPEVWWALLEHLLAAVVEAGAIAPEEDPLVDQLLAGELALTLSYLLPEIKPCRRLQSNARRALSSGLVDLLDGEGLPHARHLGLLRPLLACWTRCYAIGERLKEGPWSKKAEIQYQWLVRQALRLTRHDGAQVLSDGSAGAWDEGLFEAALEFGGDRDDRQIAARVLPGRKKRGKRRASDSALPEPAVHSEWAAVAVLRPRWSRSAERLTVLYPQRQCRTELSCGKDVLWSGPWELALRVDGRPATPGDDWEEVCWVSDDDADYLELEMEFRGGLRVQRQMLLAREDHFLLLADAVLGERPARLDYRGRLPLRPGVSFQGAEQTREGFLFGSKRRALLFPLALPEWRAKRPANGEPPRAVRGTADAVRRPSGSVRKPATPAGELEQTAEGLELRQSAEARCLYAPLFIDLDRRRMTRPATWRQLTVGESLAIQPEEVAVGYRVAVGSEQWLIYRSLAEKANRTLLGHNLSTEMLVAQFHHSGEVEPLLEIE